MSIKPSFKCPLTDITGVYVDTRSIPPPTKASFGFVLKFATTPNLVFFAQKYIDYSEFMEGFASLTFLTDKPQSRKYQEDDIGPKRKILAYDFSKYEKQTHDESKNNDKEPTKQIE